MIQAKDFFIFDGVDSRDFDALVFENDTFSSPVKEFSVASVPGRSGDLLLKNHRFQNVSHTYDVIIYRNFQRNYDALRAFLLSRESYCRLEDSLHPDEFYTAYFSGQIQPAMTRERDMGKFTLTFNRKPQRWLKSGEKPTSQAFQGGSTGSSIVVKNPTYLPCAPLIQVIGPTLSNGSQGLYIQFQQNNSYTTTTTININSYSGSGTAFDLLNSNSALTPLCIDMDSLQAYIVSGGTTYYYNNCIQYTIQTGNKYPFQMQPGNNNFVCKARISIRVIPRWYTI